MEYRFLIYDRINQRYIIAQDTNYHDQRYEPQAMYQFPDGTQYPESLTEDEAGDWVAQNLVPVSEDRDEVAIFHGGVRKPVTHIRVEDFREYFKDEESFQKFGLLIMDIGEKAKEAPVIVKYGDKVLFVAFPPDHPWLGL